MSNQWYLYVLLCSDDTFYTGVTTDPKRRLREHNISKRGAKYTNARRPVRMVYCEEHPDQSSAQKAEHAFKKLTRKQKEKLTLLGK
jgi:putative endonuclease